MSESLIEDEQTESAVALKEVVHAVGRNLSSVILGKEAAIEKVLVALVCGGNILLEDVPGIGKTTLAKALARSMGASFNRIQFTPDMLPADILGGSIYNPKSGEFTKDTPPLLDTFHTFEGGGILSNIFFY